MIEMKDVSDHRVPVAIKKTIFGENFVVQARAGETGTLQKSGHSGAFISLEGGRVVYAWRSEYELLI